MKANTYALRKVITPVLKHPTELEKRVYYNKAPAELFFPYAVYHFKNMNSNQYPAESGILHVEIFDKADTSDRIDRIADQVIRELDFMNAPNDEILPTIYFNDRDYSHDTDKGLQIIDLRFEINNYENESGD